MKELNAAFQHFSSNIFVLFTSTKKLKKIKQSSLLSNPKYLKCEESFMVSTAHLHGN